MNFGSKYVYMYDKSDSESVSDDSEPEDFGRVECDGFHITSDHLSVDSASTKPKRRSVLSKIKGMMTRKSKSTRADSDLSRGSNFDSQGWGDDDEDDDDDYDMPGGQTLQSAGETPKKKKKVRKADPNVFTISVGDYVTPDNLHPNNRKLSCGNCKAIMTSFSRFEAKAGVNDWKCEFCLNVNHDVDLSDWTKPTSDDVTFLVEAPPATEGMEQRVEDNHYVIFLIDISGSMGTTREVDNVDASGRRTRRFISRLDAVKTAAEHQIRLLKEETPNVRVGLIAFGSHISVYGDGTTPVREYSEQEMADYERLKILASDAPPLKPISETYDILIPKLLGLSILGMTALGPGLLTAIGLATNAAGSKVIICTDGCANAGIGKLPDENASEVDIARCRLQYTGFGEFAKQHSISVSVISLDGTDCRLVHLGLVAQMTGGLVDIVDPTHLDHQFGNILSNRTLATDVTVMLCLHNTLYFRGPGIVEQHSTKVEHIGNVSDDTDMVVEFGVKAIINENENPVTIADEDQQVGEHGASGGVDASEATSAPQLARNLSTIRESETVTPDTEASTSQSVLEGSIATVNQEAITSDSASGADATTGASGANTSADGSIVCQPTSDSETTELETDTLMNIHAEQDDTSAEKKPQEDLPFQLQLQFTARDATKYLRVITNLRQCTDKRETAEAEMDVNIVGAAASKEISSIALDGDYKLAKAAVKSKKKMSSRYQDVTSSHDEIQSDAMTDYITELNDLEGLVKQQEITTKQKLRGRPPPRSTKYDQMSHDGPPSIPLPPRNPTLAARYLAGATNSNLISDDLANQYYARSSKSTASYAKKKGGKKM